MAGVAAYTGNPALEIPAVAAGAIACACSGETESVEIRVTGYQPAARGVPALGGVTGFAGCAAEAAVKVLAMADSAVAKAPAACSQPVVVLARFLHPAERMPAGTFMTGVAAHPGIAAFKILSMAAGAIFLSCLILADRMGVVRSRIEPALLQGVAAPGIVAGSAGNSAGASGIVCAVAGGAADQILPAGVQAVKFVTRFFKPALGRVSARSAVTGVTGAAVIFLALEVLTVAGGASAGPLSGNFYGMKAFRGLFDPTDRMASRTVMAGVTGNAAALNTAVVSTVACGTGNEP